MLFAVGPHAVYNRQDLGVDALVEQLFALSRREFVDELIQRIEEVVADVVIRLTEVDVKHIRSHISGNGKKVVFNTFHADTGEGFQTDLNVVPVEIAVLFGILLVLGGVLFLEKRRKVSDEVPDDLCVCPVADVGTGGVGQSVYCQLNDGFTGFSVGKHGTCVE